MPVIFINPALGITPTNTATNEEALDYGNEDTYHLPLVHLSESGCYSWRS
ncbi:hypothetical protein KIH87_06075 [Paraneptunicella aestuarii]|nr:hypothetical protein [Paraneptunicella aestuarii]UAA39918.1 hypothetical protein KIH87_06075 [Paraneptunicella aestuarii]